MANLKHYLRIDLSAPCIHVRKSEDIIDFAREIQSVKKYFAGLKDVEKHEECQADSENEEYLTEPEGAERSTGSEYEGSFTESEGEESFTESGDEEILSEPEDEDLSS